MIKLGVTCEYGNECGLRNKDKQTKTLACIGEHLFEDFVEGNKYTQVIIIPEARMGYYVRSKTF
jgi:hypothetical protein